MKKTNAHQFVMPFIFRELVHQRFINIFRFETENNEPNFHDQILEALEGNKIEIKHRMVRSWQSRNAPPVLQLAGFKLIADDDERKRLQTNFDFTSGGKTIAVPPLVFADDNDE